MLTRKEYVNQAHVGEITITAVLGARHLDSRSIIYSSERQWKQKEKKKIKYVLC